MSTGIKRLLYKAIRKPFNMIGLDVVRKGDARLWRERMQLAKELGFAPKTIFDCGAFRGHWAVDVSEIFPGAQIVIAEPNPAVQDLIKRNTAHIEPEPIVLQLAIGEQNGQASFNIWGDETTDQSASLLANVSGQADREVAVEVETLDSICERLSLKPDLIKLDLQGAELPALKGGQQALEHAEFAVIEFGCLDAYVGRTTPRQLLDVMYDSGFCLYDAVELCNRPYDGALTSGDFFFVKNSSVLKSHKGWT